MKNNTRLFFNKRNKSGATINDSPTKIGKRPYGRENKNENTRLKLETLEKVWTNTFLIRNRTLR